LKIIRCQLLSSVYNAKHKTFFSKKAQKGLHIGSYISRVSSMTHIGFLTLFQYMGRTTLYQSFMFLRADMWCYFNAKEKEIFVRVQVLIKVLSW